MFTNFYVYRWMLFKNYETKENELYVFNLCQDILNVSCCVLKGNKSPFFIKREFFVC